MRIVALLLGSVCACVAFWSYIELWRMTTRLSEEASVAGKNFTGTIWLFAWNAHKLDYPASRLRRRIVSDSVKCWVLMLVVLFCAKIVLHPAPILR